MVLNGDFLNLSKQCRPWSDATFCGVWSMSVLFASVSGKCPSTKPNLGSLHSTYVTATKLARLCFTVTWIASNAAFYFIGQWQWRGQQPKGNFWCIYTLYRLYTIDLKLLLLSAILHCGSLTFKYLLYDNFRFVDSKEGCHLELFTYVAPYLFRHLNAFRKKYRSVYARF